MEKLSIRLIARFKFNSLKMEKDPKPMTTGKWTTVKKKEDNRNSKGNQRKEDYHKKGGQGGQWSPKKGIRKSKPDFFKARRRIDPILYKEWTG